MNSRVLRQGDIDVLEPGESTDFTVLEDAVTSVIKVPSAAGDNYQI